MTSSQLILVAVTSALVSVFAMLLVATFKRSRPPEPPLDPDARPVARRAEPPTEVEPVTPPRPRAPARKAPAPRASSAKKTGAKKTGAKKTAAKKTTRKAAPRKSSRTRVTSRSPRRNQE